VRHIEQGAADRASFQPLTIGLNIADNISIMRLHVRFDRWTALFLATLGSTPLLDCGGRVTSSEDTGAGGSAGTDSDAGTGSGGSTTGAGGTAGTGGSGTAGRGGTGGGAPPNPTPGRPFLIDGDARQAPLRASDTWRDAHLAPRTENLGTALCLRLSEAWAETALLEHASIAAFARFALQLLALGAPADLVEAANAAIAEETAHARLAFAVASAFAGRALSPGPLSIDGALEATSLEDVVVATIREGCIGETVSAVQATEALSYVTDPALRQVLARIADDETRHAQLAWRFVQWALEIGDAELRSAVRAEFARAKRSIAAGASTSSLDASELELVRGGALPKRLAERVHAECVLRVIAPCADALLASPRQTELDCIRSLETAPPEVA
jgi:hypothetical protein